MKRIIKSDLRRMLSVFMASVMLLTVWVFVAPTKAEASTYEGTHYLTVNLSWSCEGDFDGFSNLKATVTYDKSKVGGSNTGTVSGSLTNTSNSGSNGGSTTLTASCAGIPTKISWSADINRNGSYYGSRTVTFTVTSASLGSGSASVTGFSMTSDTNGTGSGHTNKSATSTVTCGDPVVTSIGVNAQPSNIEIPQDASYARSTAYKVYPKDQYGVRMPTSKAGTPSYTFYANGAEYDGEEVSITRSTSGDYDVITVSVSARMEDADVLNDCYLVVAYGSKTIESNHFSITDPIYEHKLYNNGGILYDADNDPIGNSTGIKQYYYSNIGGGWLSSNASQTATLPERGERLGYTYRGMYSNQQTNTNVSGWDTSTREYTWTPTGDKLTSTTKVIGNKSWYAAWQANLCKVTIYDYRGIPDIKWATYGMDLLTVAGPAITNPKQSYTRNTYNYVFSYWYIDEMYEYNNNGEQVFNTDHTDDHITNTTSWVIKGDIVIKPQYVRDGDYNHYTVTFKNKAGGNAAQYTDYRYNAPVINAADGHTAPTLTWEADNTYTYTHLGWTSIAPTSGSYYLLDSEAEAAAVCEAFSPVTDNITFYPVFYMTYIPYTVNFKYVPDGKAASDEDASTDYENHSATYHWDQDIIIPNMRNELGNQYSYTYGGGRYSFTVWDSTPVAKCAGDATYTAVYGDYEPAKYTVSFVDTRGAYGTADEPYIFAIQENIVHGANADEITVPVPDPVDIDGYRYTFNGWTLNGAAATPVLTGITADAIYSATWRRTVLCDVEFYNGSEHIADADLHDTTEGETIAYNGATPQKAPDKIADEYIFAGWQDANGNEVSTIPGGTALVKLYAKYTIVYHNYTVTFKNDAGDTILEKTDYHYHDDVVEPTAAQRAKPADDMYNYTFTRWDKPVIDVEEDAVYTAVYLRNYNYYTVTWLNDDGSVYSTGKYMFNERITAPFDAPTNKNTYPTPPTGFTLDFTGWVKYPVTDPAVSYSRSDRCSNQGATYIATFGNVADIITVTLYDSDGTSKLGEFNVEYGSKLSDQVNQSKLTTPKLKKDADKHYAFEKYVKMDGTDYSYESAITEDLSLKAKYDAGTAHHYVPKTVTEAPTFTTPGQAVEMCDEEGCGWENDTEVPALIDTIDPTVTLYVRDVTWNAEGVTAALNAAAIVQTAPANLLAVTTADKAQVNANYNPNGDGSKVQTIDVIIVESDTVKSIEEIEEDEDWYNVYTRAADDEGNAYISDVIRNAANDLGLEHGDKFVIYVKAVDLLDNTTYVRSSVLQYDTQSPDLIIGKDGEPSNEAKTVFCGAPVTVKVDTDASSYTLTVGGNAVDTDENDEYIITAPGFYSVTVRDVAGNSITKNIEIKSGHTDTEVKINPSCEGAGSKYNKCSICGRTTAPTAIDPLGHEEYTITVAPTCTADGYDMTYCRRCNEALTEPGTVNVVPKFDHTYPDDAETYGEHAGASAWVENELLHKNPTCSATGSEYWTCQLCGLRETRVIPIDPDAHNYYNGVTTDPTCTEDGYITFTCRYDNSHTDVIRADNGDYAYLKATGHTDGEWRIITPATCAEAGEKVLTCAVCHEDIGEHVTVPALEPVFEARVTPPSVPSEGNDGRGYVDYICKNCNGAVEGHSYREYTDDPLTEVTIKFLDGNETDPSVPYKSFTKLSGEGIAESEVPDPVKPSDGVYNYTFEGWKDGNGTFVTFPIIAGDADLTLTASYAERYINYTLILNRADGSQFKKLGYQHNDGSSIDLSSGPYKESDPQTVYTFSGWSYAGSTPFTTIRISDLVAAGMFDEDNVTVLTPNYTETARKYTVVFGYDVNHVLATVEVGYHEDAVYPGDTALITKDYDEFGHYVFSGWSAELTQVAQNIFAKPVFEKIAHVYTAATNEIPDSEKCTTPETTTYTCGCGYSYSVVTSPALGHDWGEGVGGVQTCTRCGETREDNTLYTIAFMVDGAKYKSYTIKYGETFSKPADPTKEADAQNTYAFAYWYTTDDATAVEVNTTCTGNITYYAKFDPTERLFSVAFGYNANDIIKTYTNIPYGGSVTYNGPTPVKASDSNYHYTFTGWNKDTSEVTEKMNVYANFSKDSHSFDSGEEQSAATCQHGKIMKYTCPECGYSYTKETGSALQHNWEEKERAGGYIIYECSYCHTQKAEPLPSISLKVTVKDQNGNPVSGVTVKVYETDANGGAFVNSGVTNGNGVATISVPEAKTYRIEIEGKSANITVDANGNITSGSVPTVERNNGGGNTSHGCDCTCHKSGLWPTIFRFFHKIIKLITGEFRCCPDAHY